MNECMHNCVCVCLVMDSWGSMGFEVKGGLVKQSGININSDQ